MSVNLPNISHNGSSVRFKLNTSRLGKNLARAQFWLDSQIMTDMVPLMPMQTGVFINQTRAMSASLAGTGIIIAAAPPFGRYLYFGKVMVNAETGKGPTRIQVAPGEYILRWPKGARLVATARPLTYSRAGAEPEWFEVAKARHKNEWLAGVRRVSNGG